MLNITIKTIPHNRHRYETVGDWIFKRGKFREILVSDMKNSDYEILVGVHELIEAHLCQRDGITEKEVNKFDIEYEKARENKVKAPCGCLPTEVSEPGDDKHAPYGKFHRFATKLERQFCKELGIDWDKYNNTVETL